MTSQTVLLNSDYSFLSTISLQKAIRLITKGKAEIVKSMKDKVIRNYENTVNFGHPVVIKLVKFVRLMYGKSVPLSKRNILLRDGYQCQYCGKQFRFGSKSITLDHIVPRSKGGDTTWLNCVASCKQCNTFKGSKKISETSLTLLKQPVKPTIGEFIMTRMRLSGLDKMLNELFNEME